MKITKFKLLMLLISIFLSNGQPTTSTLSRNDSRSKFVIDSIKFFVYPLFSRPAFILPGSTLEIELKLPQDIIIHELTLYSDNDMFEVNFTLIENKNSYRKHKMESMIPTEANLGLYTLELDTSTGKKYSWNFVQIIVEFPYDFSFIRISDIKKRSKNFRMSEM